LNGNQKLFQISLVGGQWALVDSVLITDN